jgi:UDP-2,3-diacylglucosamine hydrolase
MPSPAVPISRGSALPIRYFIADLHLDGEDTQRAISFRNFLDRLSTEAGQRSVELYILGDLFEFWYEYRKQLFEIYAADLRALDAAAQAGVKIFLFFGNRDFAYGKYVTKRFGATVLGDGQAITLNDHRPAWLEHGDLLCTADRRYLRFRRVVRSWPVRLLFRGMPWSMARRTIERMRKKTAADKARKSTKEVEIDFHAARRRLEHVHCKLLLCGHTHRPVSEDLGAGYRLIVLPPWCESPGGYVDDRGLTMFNARVPPRR